MSALVWISPEADLIQVQEVVLRGEPGKTWVGGIRSEIGKGRQARKSALLSRLSEDGQLELGPTGELRHLV